MKHKIIALMLAFSLTFSTTACGETKVDSEKDVSVTESTTDNSTTVEQVENPITNDSPSLQSESQDNSFNSIPAGMSEEIYAYGITVLNYTNDYLNNTISLEDAYEGCKEFMIDLILANKSSLSPIDKECYDNFFNCYNTIKNLDNENFTKYSKEDFEYVLPLFRDKLSDCLSN